MEGIFYGYGPEAAGVVKQSRCGSGVQLEMMGTLPGLYTVGELCKDDGKRALLALDTVTGPSTISCSATE